MAGSVNEVNLIGHLGRDPEMKYTTGGKAITQFSVATSSSKKAASGEWVEETEWHNIKAFEKSAEIAAQYLVKGSQVAIRGRIQTEKWTDKNTGAEKSKVVILVDRLTLLGKPEKKTAVPPTSLQPLAQAMTAPMANAYVQNTPPLSQAAFGDLGVTDEDLPF